MGKKTAGILLLLLFACSANTQTLKHYLEWGDENMAVGDAYGASLYYEKAMEIDSNNIEVLWKYAESLRQYNNYAKAEWYYQKVFDRGRGRIYPMATFHLAQMLKYNGKYRDSRKVWRRVGRVLGREDEYYDEKADQESKSCNWARRMLSDTANVNIENMGDGVNSIHSEFSPFFFNNTLYFTSLRANDLKENMEVHDDHYVIKIYTASGATDYFTTDGPLDTLINSVLSHNANAVISPDGNRLYFSRCIPDGNCDIYISRKNDDGSWSKPDKVGGDINGRSFTSTQPHIVNYKGTEYLFFVSDMEGTHGMLDIWYSIVTKDGNRYSKPRNLGKQINTPDNDISPYYDTSKTALYFSSSWHYGYGGQDIFIAQGAPDKLGPPENMGLPFNTSVNDMYFRKDPENDRAFLTSNRKGSIYKKSPTCCNDIWMVKYETEEEEDTAVYKSLEDLNKFLPVTLYFHNDRPGPNSMDTAVDLNYLTTYKRYTEMTQEYKDKYSEGLSKEEAIDAQDDIGDFFREKVDQGVEDLEMFTGLLMSELQKGRKVEMTIQGFASPLAATEYNVNLTYRRISSLVNYLREYEGGVMAPYLDGTAENGGSLSFVKIPKGEFTADHQHISDNPNDTKNSVFSISAALERKIEIKSVQQANQRDSIYAEIHFDKEFHTFGVLPPGVTKEHTFKFSNTGNKDLSVDSLEIACDCIDADFEPVTLAPGEQASFRIRLNTEELNGFIEKTVIVKSNAVQGDKELSITVEVKKDASEGQ